MALSLLSVQSRLLTATWNDQELGTATGFIVAHGDKPYLVTNWHVVAGRHPETDEILSSHGMTPDVIVIRHFISPVTSSSMQLMWQDFKEPLLGTDEKPLWLEHPQHGRNVDVVALPLTNVTGAQMLPYDYDGGHIQPRIAVSEWVNIIGFPFGPAASGSIAIWTKGAIASEPELDFNGLPYFLIDARTRQGQSGSPVVFHTHGGPITRDDGSVAIMSGTVTKLLGVYAGRINPESDLGRVWKARVIAEILAQAD